MNIADALLTIVWVQNGVATEANGIMNAFLSMGALPFLAAKLAMGTFFAVVMLAGSNYTLARVGVTLVLLIYGVTMGIHVFTGVAAFA